MCVSLTRYGGMRVPTINSAEPLPLIGADDQHTIWDRHILNSYTRPGSPEALNGHRIYSITFQNRVLYNAQWTTIRCVDTLARPTKT